MGSFNTSCFASNQTIKPGTLTYIFPVHQQSTSKPVELNYQGNAYQAYGAGQSSCHTVAHWGYCGPLILGVYSDYGRFDLVDTPDNRTNVLSFFEYLNVSMFEAKKGDNEYHDLGIDFNQLYDSKLKATYNIVQLQEIWDAVWEVAQKYRAFVVGRFDGQPKALQFAVMHHACAKYLVELTEAAQSWDLATQEQYSVFNEFVKERSADYPFSSKYDWVTRVAKIVTSLPGYLFGHYEGVNIGKHYAESYSSFEQILTKHKTEIESREELGDDVINELFQSAKSQLDHRYINTGMESLNLKLSPMVYASQDYDNEIGRDYARMIRRVSKLASDEAKKD